MELFFLRTLKELKKKGISQRDLAEICGLSQATISSVVRGRPCKIETFEVLLDGVYKAKGWSKVDAKWNVPEQSSGLITPFAHEIMMENQPELFKRTVACEAEILLETKQLQEDISKTILDKKTIAERFLSFITLGVCG